MAGGNSHQRKMAKKAMERLEKKVTNAVVERLSGSSQEVLETAPAKQRGLPQLVKYLRGIGIIGLLLGGSGIVFTKPILFWWAAGFLWLGLLAWAVDVWFEPNIGRWLRWGGRSEEHTSELQSRLHLVCRLLLEKKKKELSPVNLAGE